MQSSSRHTLTVFDAVCIIVGIIIGTGIFESAPIVARGAGSIGAGIGIWIAGGFASLCGALCYAELATTYPRSGGDYVYLSRAFGPLVGFLFAWGRSVIVQPCSIAALAFPFSRYLETLWQPFAGTSAEPHTRLIFAVSAIVFVTLLNCAAVTTSRLFQNFLTVLKASALLFISFVGFSATPAVSHAVNVEPDLTLALIMVLFTYGGWNEIAFVTSEMKNPERDITRALTYGVLLVTTLYVLVNLSFFYALGWEGVVASPAVATETTAQGLPGIAAPLVSLIICISTLSAINALSFVGARVSAALGRNMSLLKFLSGASGTGKNPIVALLVQGALSVAIVLIAASFEGAVVYGTTVVYLFFFLTALSLPVLRRKEPKIARPYRTPWYPLPLIPFIGTTFGMIVSAGLYNLNGSIISFAVLAAGIPIYLYSFRTPEIENL